MAEDGSQRRKNAWQWPVGCRQTTSIIVVFGNAIAFRYFLFPLLPVDVRAVLNILFTISWLLTLAGGAWTMTLDPVDEWVVETERNTAPETREEDYLRCHYCKSMVQMESKHCWDCNKCVSDFDHHCPWVNNCIGSANYKPFYVTIWSVFSMLAVTTTAAIVVLIPNGSVDMRQNPFNLPEFVILILCICLLVVDGLLLCLDATLVAFHTYLCIADITTYEYLTGKTSKKKQMAKMRKEAGEDIAENGDDSSYYQQTPARKLHAASIEEQEDSSDADSSDDEVVNAGEVFKSSFLAKEQDGDVTKEVSDFMFGSKTATVELPSLEPRSGQMPSYALGVLTSQSDL